VFASWIQDLIQWAPGADGVWRPHNVGEARTIGLESDASIEFSLLSVPLIADASYTYLQAQDATGDPVTGGRRLVGRPAHSGFAEVGWRDGSWSLSTGFRGTSRVPLTAANTKWQEGSLLVHARIGRQLRPGLRLELEGRNLFDVPVEDIRGYPSPGRQVVVAVRFDTGALP
jgi:outer membrane receptor protein involved in Fe transport